MVIVKMLILGKLFEKYFYTQIDITSYISQYRTYINLNHFMLLEHSLLLNVHFNSIAGLTKIIGGDGAGGIAACDHV